MAFMPFTYLAEPVEWEYLEASGPAALTVGEALTVTGGKVTKAGPTVRPSYISMYEGNTVTGKQIPVQRVLESTVYETTFSVSGTATEVGKRYTLAAGGDQITATDASGVAEIVRKDETAAAGDKVWVRFPTAAAGA